MNRRDLIKSSLLTAGALAASPVQARQEVQPAESRVHVWPGSPHELNGGKMPNILWICPDMQRFDTIEGLNNSAIRTPNLRKLMEMVDLAPTLLEAAGIPIPVGMQGRSLTLLLTGNASAHRDSIYCEYFDSLALYDPPPMAMCVRTEQFKLAYYQKLNVGEFYDLEKDPNETNNLWDSSSAKSDRDRMMLTLLDRAIDTVDPNPERKCLR